MPDEVGIHEAGASAEAVNSPGNSGTVGIPQMSSMAVNTTWWLLRRAYTLATAGAAISLLCQWDGRDGVLEEFRAPHWLLPTYALYRR